MTGLWRHLSIPAPSRAIHSRSPVEQQVRKLSRPSNAHCTPLAPPLDSVQQTKLSRISSLHDMTYATTTPCPTSEPELEVVQTGFLIIIFSVCSQTLSVYNNHHIIVFLSWSLMCVQELSLILNGKCHLSSCQFPGGQGPSDPLERQKLPWRLHCQLHRHHQPVLVG